MDTAIFAGGCFWGVQYYFDQVPGVVKTIVGYTGGHVANPTYEMVTSHMTGHAEAVEIVFDPKKVSYATLLKHFFRLHNPTLHNSDGVNVGPNYRSAIFYLNDQQKKLAETEIRNQQKKYKDPIVTELTLAEQFYPAEAYHQKFTKRTGIGMCHIDYAPIG